MLTSEKNEENITITEKDVEFKAVIKYFFTKYELNENSFFENKKFEKEFTIIKQFGAKEMGKYGTFIVALNWYSQLFYILIILDFLNL